MDKTGVKTNRLGTAAGRISHFNIVSDLTALRDSAPPKKGIMIAGLGKANE
jgi:hypothetical protein